MGGTLPRDVRQPAQPHRHGDADTSLLHRSVRDNITAAAYRDADVHLRLSGPNLRLHRPADRPAGRTGFDAQVGERGVKLYRAGSASALRDCAGDAERRAHLLDEATSALDSEFEVAHSAT
jgi:ATP-binding cassette subfamily B multidrug efflux pump